MKVRAGQMEAYYGELVGALALASIGHCLDAVLACGPARISKAFDFDGLYVTTPHITMGIVFHEWSTVQIQKALARHNVTADEIKANLNHSNPNLRWPQPGEWSLHS